MAIGRDHDVVLHGEPPGRARPSRQLATTNLVRKAAARELEPRDSFDPPRRGADDDARIHPGHAALGGADLGAVPGLRPLDRLRADGAPRRRALARRRATTTVACGGCSSSCPATRPAPRSSWSPTWCPRWATRTRCSRTTGTTRWATSGSTRLGPNRTTLHFDETAEHRARDLRVHQQAQRGQHAGGVAVPHRPPRVPPRPRRGLNDTRTGVNRRRRTPAADAGWCGSGGLGREPSPSSLRPAIVHGGCGVTGTIAAPTTPVADAPPERDARWSRDRAGGRRGARAGRARDPASGS